MKNNISSDSSFESKIIFVEPGEILEYEGRYYLPERTVLGLNAYYEYLQKNYPNLMMGIVAVQGTRSVSMVDLENLKLIPESLSALVYPNLLVDLLASTKNLLYFSLLNDSTIKVFGSYRNVVYLVENPRSVRYELLMSEYEGSALGRLRIYLGSYRNELKRLFVLSRSRGVQANGDAAYKIYSLVNKNSVLFYDHRVSGLPEMSLRDGFKNGSAMNVAFSGRIINIKGSKYIPEISRYLYDLNPNIKIYLIGDGEQLQGVLESSAPNIEYKGFMSFKDEWEPFVRENIDLMLLPHIQGDPSMTYFESLGQGVPIIGFKNETLKHLAEKNLAWSFPKGDSKGIAGKIYDLNNNPNDLQRKSELALQFMGEHLYSKVVSRRMEHLVATLGDMQRQENAEVVGE